MLATWKDLESLLFITTASVLDLTPFSSPENMNSEDLLQTCPTCKPVAHLTPALCVWPAADLLVFFFFKPYRLIQTSERNILYIIL